MTDTTKAPGNINDWTEFLTTVDLPTQLVASPFPDPYMAAPTVSFMAGTPLAKTYALNPRNWATKACAQQIAHALGGYVTTSAPSWAPGPLSGGFSYDQPKFYVYLANGTAIDPAMLANMFPGNLAVLKQALPMFLGITPGGMQEAFKLGASSLAKLTLNWWEQFAVTEAISVLTLLESKITNAVELAALNSAIEFLQQLLAGSADAV